MQLGMVKAKKRPWWEKVDTKYLLRRLAGITDRMEMAAVLVELADRADRNAFLHELLGKLQLPPPFHVFEYRKASGKKGYWARIPYTREHPSAGELEARLTFSEIAYSLYGTKGTVERPDGTRIGCVNHLQGEIMRGMEIVSNEDKVERQKQKAVERIAQAAEPTARSVTSSPPFRKISKTY